MKYAKSSPAYEPEVVADQEPPRDTTMIFDIEGLQQVANGTFEFTAPHISIMLDDVGPVLAKQGVPYHIIDRALERMHDDICLQMMAEVLAKRMVRVY